MGRDREGLITSRRSLIMTGSGSAPTIDKGGGPGSIYPVRRQFLPGSMRRVMVFRWFSFKPLACRYF